MTYSTPGQAPLRTEGGRTDAGSYVDWPAIIAGTVLAVALAFVLLSFGSGIGLSVTSFEPGEGVSLAWLSIASGIWFVWTAVTSFAAGGYLAGRLRRPFAGATPDEVETRDGAHGVLVWATATLVAAVLAASGVGGLVGAATSGAATAAGTVSQAAIEAVGGDMEYLGGRLLRGGESATPQTGEAVATVLRRSLRDGQIAEEDRAYLADVVAEQTGIPPEEAATQVDAVIAEAQEVYQAAIATVEQARTAAAIGAFVVAATLMVGAAAGYFSATTGGGEHRDLARPFRSFGPSRP